MQRRHAATGALVLALGLVVSGCEASGGGGPIAYPRRFDPIGTVAAPERPFVPGKLPAGWRETARELEAGERGASTSQAVFMPAASTPTSGPALVAGYITDDEYDPYQCDPSATDGTGHDIIRWGRGLSAMRVAGPGYITLNGAYVMGRDVDDAALRRAAASVRWPEWPATDWPPDFTKGNPPPTMELPPRFRLRATGGLAAHEHPWAARVQLRAREDQWIWIGQEEDNTAAVFLADFWRSVTRGQRCTGAKRTVERTVIRGDTVIRLQGPDTPAVRRVMAEVERGLHRVSRREFGGNQHPALPDAATSSSEP